MLIQKSISEDLFGLSIGGRKNGRVEGKGKTLGVWNLKNVIVLRSIASYLGPGLFLSK